MLIYVYIAMAYDLYPTEVSGNKGILNHLFFV